MEFAPLVTTAPTAQNSTPPSLALLELTILQLVDNLLLTVWTALLDFTAKDLRTLPLLVNAMPGISAPSVAVIPSAPTNVAVMEFFLLLEMFWMVVRALKATTAHRTPSSRLLAPTELTKTSMANRCANLVLRDSNADPPPLCLLSVVAVITVPSTLLPSLFLIALLDLSTPTDFLAASLPVLSVLLATTVLIGQ